MNASSYPYPYLRSWDVESIEIDRYDAIQDNWRESKGLLQDIRSVLDDESMVASVKTVVAAGSLGRMEAKRDLSDGDLIIVLSEGLEAGEETEIYEDIWSRLQREPLKLPRPKEDGLFGSPTTQEELISSIGKADENLRVFGRRLLILLETQPVFGDSAYEELINQIVDKYAENYVARDSKKEWTLLLNDLIRYFRSLCVNYQWDFENEAGKWPLRNVKLRHSRILMYTGLLFLLGESSKQRIDKVNWLKQRLKWTPLERVAHVYEDNHDWNFHRVAGLYNNFLSDLRQEKIRKLLNSDPVEDSPAEDRNPSSYSDRYNKPEFARLKANSDALIAELLRFVFARRGTWTERFFEYLIF